MPARPALLKFPAQMPVKPQFGERLRLKIVEGDQLGVGFSLLDERILLGRDDDCDLIVVDEKVSRKHAEMVWHGNHYIIRDLESINGLYVNTAKVKEARLEIGDSFSIGSTVFAILAVGDSAKNFSVGNESLSKQRVKHEEEKKLKKQKTIFILAVFILLMIAFSSSEEVVTFRQGVYVSLTDSDKPLKKLKRKEARELVKKNLPKYKVSKGSKDRSGFKDAEVFFHQGNRELQNKNYGRAINSFETALTIYPKHQLAKKYLEIAKKDLEKDVKRTYRSAIVARKAFRYTEAKMHYRTVMRLLARNPEHKTYKESEEALRIIAVKESGEE